MPCRSLTARTFQSGASTVRTSRRTEFQLFQPTHMKNARIAMNLKIISFGYKYGETPLDSDVIIDTRAIYNPARIPDLYYRNGFDDAVKNDVQTSELYPHVLNLAITSVKVALSSGLRDFTVAFGCTAGKHRSVVLAESLGKTLWGNDKIEKIDIVHQERERWPVAKGRME